MDQTPGSYRRSSVVHSMPEDAHTFDVSSIYPSPVSVTTSQGLGFSPVGLGISGCGLEPAFDNLRAFPGSVPFAASSAAPNQTIPTENYYDIPLKVDDFSDRPCFPVYNGIPHASDSPLSPYDSRTMGVSPSYNTSLEVDETGVFALQVPGYWATTPCSGPTTPLEAVPATGHWNQPYFPELCITANPPMLPDGRGFYPLETVAGGSRTPTNHFNPAQLPPSPHSATSTESFSPISPQRFNRNDQYNSNQKDKDLEEGRKCRVCGYVFTRRSNCTEHQKRHDPSLKKIFNCDECKKTFGRNADLRRHIENIHRRMRKHVCEWCDLKLSGHNSLTKHADECEMRPCDASSSAAIRSSAEEDIKPTSASSQKQSFRSCRSGSRH